MEKDSRNEIDDKILEVIEQSIKERNEDCASFAKSLKKKLFAICPKEQIKERIKEILKYKKISFMRHLRAEHSGKKLEDFYDSQIIEEGKVVAKEFIESYKNETEKYDLIFISPLRRCLQSFQELYEAFKDSNPKLVVTDLIRERLTEKVKNAGQPLPKLKELIQATNINFDTSYILNKTNWWIDIDWEEYNQGKVVLGEDYETLKHDREEDIKFTARVFVALLWSLFRKEKNILWLAHSKVYKTLHVGSKIKNGLVDEFQTDIIIERMNTLFDDDEKY